jgi:DNA-binding response OmpR family regulator
VTKPFSPTELIARVDALFRRVGGTDDVEERTDICGGPFVLNMRNRTLTKNGELVKVTQVEYTIMKMFIENPSKALSREEILAHVWGRDYYGDLKIVDVNIRRLRLKIEEDTAKPKYITTVWGYGYKWES